MDDFLSSNDLHIDNCYGRWVIFKVREKENVKSRNNGNDYSINMWYFHQRALKTIANNAEFDTEEMLLEQFLSKMCLNRCTHRGYHNPRSFFLSLTPRFCTSIHDMINSFRSIPAQFRNGYYLSLMQWLGFLIRKGQLKG